MTTCTLNNTSYERVTLIFFYITWFFFGDPLDGMLNYPSIYRFFSSFRDNESSKGWFASFCVVYVYPLAFVVVGHVATVLFFVCSAAKSGFSCVCKMIVSKSVFALGIAVSRASPWFAGILVLHELSSCLWLVLQAAIAFWLGTEVDFWCSVVVFRASKTTVLFDFHICHTESHKN